ncbi:hypothetical protein [Polaribacter sp. Z022]|uniref:hypothetical protein n=1 Tax=Polaribacter sp. Z022 TaxID=2927125 RepID=UPI0020204820|nr:hypothetical protein [Polaribacter sp. Z022]MCL7754968.1 hypothetical protein [Polaribacter sp. Z022]
MKEIKELVDYFLTSRNIYGVEEAIDIIVSKTTTYNYKEIIHYIENHPEYKIESDITIYLAEIANKDLPELETIIKERLKIFTSKSGIEDLNEALQKINY